MRPGRFIKPRAIGVQWDKVFVIDTTGRVQVFAPDGEFLYDWAMPDAENGTPTAIAFAGERVLIADTHYSAIREYTDEGELVREWGDYGAGAGQFVYPTDVETDGAGRYFVSEYGMGAERVQVFDEAGVLLRSWGGHGEAEGEFNRAMALFVGDAGEVFVCDTANHRIQRFTAAGEFVQAIGEAGTAPGRLQFPYDVAPAGDGTFLVSEYGAHRISRFALDGEYVGSFGKPGRNPGQFDGPRGVACGGGAVYAADTGNHRIQRFPLSECGA